MLDQYKTFMKIYSIAVVMVVIIRMFFHKKSNAVEFAALIPTFIYLCNL